MLSLRRKTLPFGCCCWESVHLLSILWYQIGASWCPPFGDVKAQSLAKWRVPLPWHSVIGWERWLLALLALTRDEFYNLSGFLLGPQWTLKVEPILNLTNHPYSLNWLSREQIVKVVKYFPFVSTPRPMMSLTPQVLSPTSSAEAPSFSPLLELVLMPPTPRNTQTHIPPEPK